MGGNTDSAGGLTASRVNAVATTLIQKKLEWNGSNLTAQINKSI